MSNSTNGFLMDWGAPTVGAIFSSSLALGPMAAVLEARTAGNLGDVNPDVFPVLFVNCVAWGLYGKCTGGPTLLSSLPHPAPENPKWSVSSLSLSLLWEVYQQRSDWRPRASHHEPSMSYLPLKTGTAFSRATSIASSLTHVLLFPSSLLPSVCVT